IAGTVSYLHMHTLVELHGQPGWVAALTPLSVDGMIVAASTTLLADSRAGERGGVLPWALLVGGSAASPAANIAAGHPTAGGRAGDRGLAIVRAHRRLRAAHAPSPPQRCKRGQPQRRRPAPQAYRPEDDSDAAPRLRRSSGPASGNRRAGHAEASRDVRRQA